MKSVFSLIITFSFAFFAFAQTQPGNNGTPPSQTGGGSTTTPGSYPNVGIGAAADPDHKLYVRGINANASSIFAENTGSGNSAHAIEGYTFQGNAILGRTDWGTGVYGSASSALGFAGRFDGRLQVTNTGQVAAITGINPGGYAARFDGLVGLSRINANLTAGNASFNAGTGALDGASILLFPDADPNNPGGLRLITGDGSGNGGDIRFQRYNNGNTTTNMQIRGDGKVGVGDVDMSAGGFRLFVEEGIATGRVKVDQSWADYVFDDCYKMLSLEEVKAFIDENGHLPNTPSESEIIANGGFELGTMTVKQQEKIEELFLHMIDMEQRMRKFEAALEQSKQENMQLKAALQNTQNTNLPNHED